MECSLIPGQTRDSSASGRDVRLGSNIGTVGRYALVARGESDTG